MYVYRAEVVRVVDGDTIDLRVDLGFRVSREVRVRVYGVDTPEIYSVKKDSDEYNAGMAAKAYVEQWCQKNGNVVYLRSKKTGKYGRWLGMLWHTLEDVDKTELSLSASLLQDGLAQPYEK